MDKVLKQRLVGAAILIALAVIFLPMLFDDPVDEPVQRQLALDLPERSGDDQREIRRLPLDPDQARRPPPETQAPAEDELPVPTVPETETPSPEPEDDGASSDSRTGRSETSDPAREVPVADREIDMPPAADEDAQSEQSSAASGEETSETQPATPAEEPVAGGDWAVQVAVFSNRATAEDIRERLEDLGHSVSMDVLVRDQAELFRLRTGPYAARSGAEAARSQIEATIAGVDPVVRETAGVAESQQRSGYAVQVGSFASHNNAERLVAQLRSDDYDAFIHEEASGGRIIWRVRVGTYDERGPAEALLQTLREAAGLEGIVVSQP